MFRCARPSSGSSTSFFFPCESFLAFVMVEMKHKSSVPSAVASNSAFDSHFSFSLNFFFVFSTFLYCLSPTGNVSARLSRNSFHSPRRKATLPPLNPAKKERNHISGKQQSGLFDGNKSGGGEAAATAEEANLPPSKKTSRSASTWLQFFHHFPFFQLFPLSLSRAER